MNSTEIASPIPPTAYGQYSNRSADQNKVIYKYTYIKLESESSESSENDGSESVKSIQEKETEWVQDTSDTDWTDEDQIGEVIEYDVISSSEEKKSSHFQFIEGETSSDTDEKTIISIAVLEEGGLDLADSEYSLSSSEDKKFSHFGYPKCTKCANSNNNPMFQYCERCYKNRKEFFPPRPKWKKRKSKKNGESKFTVNVIRNTVPSPKFDFKNIVVPNNLKNKTVIKNDSTDLVNNSVQLLGSDVSSDEQHTSHLNINSKCKRKRSLEDECEIESKKHKAGECSSLTVIKKTVISDIIITNDINNDTHNRKQNCSLSDAVSSFSQPMFSSFDVERISKSVSDPGITFSKDDMDVSHSKLESDNISLDKEIAHSINNKDDPLKNYDSGTCMVCLVEPKSGVFVHGRIAHICCCYKCSLKVWTKTRRCPICNCKVSNVLKAYVI